MECARLLVHALIEGAAGLKQANGSSYTWSSTIHRQGFDTLELCPFAQLKKSQIFLSETGKFSG
jgi:hypothetical protein